MCLGKRPGCYYYHPHQRGGYGDGGRFGPRFELGKWHCFEMMLKVNDVGEKNGEIANLRLRYKKPGESKSVLWQQPIQAASRTSFAEAPVEARFATAVAGFGQILRGAVNVEDFGLDDVARIARAARGEDSFGYRAEFLQMVRMAKSASALEPLNN